MKSLISLIMVMLLAFSMMHLAVAQYSGTMNTKLLYGVAKEVRSGVRYSMVTVGEGLQSSTSPAKSHFYSSSTTHRSNSSSQRVYRKKRAHAARSRYARYALRS